MKPDKRALASAHRLRRVREAEWQMAARDVAEREAVVARADTLAKRSITLAHTHSIGRQSLSGTDLYSRAMFTNGVSDLARLATREAEGARIGAQSAREGLAIACHRRDRASERADTLSKQLAAAGSAASNPVLARKLNR